MHLYLEIFIPPCHAHLTVLCGSPHAVTGFLGLALLSVQTAVSTQFQVSFSTSILSQNHLQAYSSALPLPIWSLTEHQLLQANPDLRNVHAILGTGIMALFLLHAVFGLQLGLS